MFKILELAATVVFGGMICIALLASAIVGIRVAFNLASNVINFLGV